VLWCTTEARDEALRALDGDDDAVVTLLRGHLEITGVTTVARLADETRLAPSRVASGLAALERHGFVLQGRYTPEAAETEWIARRLLARMHVYSRRSRRAAARTVTAQDFMRFLLRWQHVAPGTQLGGEQGLVTVLEQLQGYESPAVAWEPEVLTRRLRHYDPRWLDRLCHDGEVAWLRLTPRPRDDDAPSTTAPSKATPISVVLRDDLGWLLAAARATATTAEPSVGGTAEVLEVLRSRGASFAGELAAATRRLPDDIERALWDGMARGLITCDGFGAIRARVGTGGSAGTGRSSGDDQPRPDGRTPSSGRFSGAARLPGSTSYGAGRHTGRPPRLSRLGRTLRPTGASAGRWSLVPPPEADLDRHELAEAVAEQLLRRWGVVFRDLAVHDGLRLPWREVQWALRRLEDRGLVRGGRFVAGFSGEQYALPVAVEQLDHVRKLARTGERVVVNATDPLNLVGQIVPGPTVASVRTNHVVYVDGVPPSTSAATG
jgi:ATP-dependent Lhr-like helicase